MPDDGLANHSPYRLILQGTFEQLAPVLRHIHGASGPRSAAGVLAVERGRGRVARMLAAAMRLPRASPAVAVDLIIEQHGRRECWRRSFGGQAVITWQTAADGMLCESAGPATMSFALAVEAGGLVMHSQRVRVLGLPLPQWLAPQIVATEQPLEGGWQVEVEIRQPGVGRIVRYSGVMVVGQDAPPARPIDSTRSPSEPLEST